MHKRLTLLALLFVLSTGMGFSQLLNGDFESWEPNGGQPYPTGWPNLNGAFDIQSPQAISGNYSLQLNAWYYYTETTANQEGPISQAYSFLNGEIRYKSFRNALILTPDTITRYNDTAWVEIYMTHYDAILQRRDTVGQGIVFFTSNTEDSLSVAFQIPIQYTSSTQPDSFRLYIDPSMIRRNFGVSYFVGNSSGYCSYLTIDNLFFDNTLNTEGPSNLSPLSIYPNPGQNHLSVRASQKGTVSLWSIQGVKCMETETDGWFDTRWDVSHLAPGTYLVRWEGDNAEATSGQIWIKH